MPEFNLQEHGITVKDILRNPNRPRLYEEAIRHEPGTTLSDRGALIAYSGEKTGRSVRQRRVRRTTRRTSAAAGSGSPDVAMMRPTSSRPVSRPRNASPVRSRSTTNASPCP